MTFCFPVDAQLKKHRELTISTLGMSPKKFTAAGAPAVSMDVLNDLAGNPYEVWARCFVDSPVVYSPVA